MSEIPDVDMLGGFRLLVRVLVIELVDGRHGGRDRCIGLLRRREGWSKSSMSWAWQGTVRKTYVTVYQANVKCKSRFRQGRLGCR